MSDGTQAKAQDGLPEGGQTSEQKKAEGTSQKQEPKTHSQEYVTQLLSDQASEFGRTRKDLETQLKAANLAASDRNQLQSRLDEILGIKDDPDGKAAYVANWERQLKERESGLATRESKVADWEKTQKENERLGQITGIAKELGVDPKELAKKVEDMGVTALSGIKFIAETMVEKKAEETDTEDFTPSSGLTPGGVTPPKTPHERISKGLKELK